jgi:hypothetical protein
MPEQEGRSGLNSPPTSAMQIKLEQRALEEAIRKVEAEASIRPVQTEASTALLVASMLLLPAAWIIDPTSVSLYWVSRVLRR